MKFRHDRGLPLLAGHIIKNIVPLQSAYLMGIMERKKKSNQQQQQQQQQQNITVRPSKEAVYQNQGQAQLHLVLSLIHSPLFW
jgi:hypothetical protein